MAEEQRNLLFSKKKECPKCQSPHIDPTLTSYKLMAMDDAIGYECNDCGHLFFIYKHNITELEKKK